MLFWVCVVKEPLKKDKEEKGELETIISQPQIIVAKDDKSAAIKAIRQVVVGDSELDRVQVIVRPF